MYRYIGNKTKLLPHITNRIREMIGDTGTVADIMAGTGSVCIFVNDVRPKNERVIVNH